MRTLSKAEQAFLLNTSEHVHRVKEQRRNRRRNRSLYNHREAYSQPVHCSASLVILIKSGFTLEQALELLGRH